MIRYRVELISYNQLLARGWSSELISKIFPVAGPDSYFALPAILKAEQSRTYKRAKPTLSQGELAYLRSEIEIDTELPLEKLREEAMRRWQDRHPAVPPPAAQKHRDRLAVNHARHRLSNLHSFYGKVRPFACQAARNMILAEIAEAWPDLAVEAFDQMSLIDEDELMADPGPIQMSEPE